MENGMAANEKKKLNDKKDSNKTLNTSNKKNTLLHEDLEESLNILFPDNLIIKQNDQEEQS